MSPPPPPSFADNLISLVNSILVNCRAFKTFLESLPYRHLPEITLAYYNSLPPLQDDTKTALQIGVTLGACVCSFLAFFPGEPFDYTKLDGGRGDGEANEEDRTPLNNKNKKKKKKKRGENLIVNELNSTDANDNDNDNDNDNNNDDNDKDKAEAEPVLSLDWDTAKIMAKTSKMQKLFGLDDNQMNQAIKNAKLEAEGEKITMNRVRQGDAYDSNNPDNEYSLSQKVDFIVYGTLFSLFCYFMNRDFGPQTKLWLINNFPKESKVFGLETDWTLQPM